MWDNKKILSIFFISQASCPLTKEEDIHWNKTAIAQTLIKIVSRQHSVQYTFHRRIINTQFDQAKDYSVGRILNTVPLNLRITRL